MDPFEAFDRFCQMRYNGECVDAYAAHLRNLAKQAKIDSDEVIRKKLVTSLPVEISRQLRALINSTDADLPRTVTLARTLMTNFSGEGVIAAAKDRRSVAAVHHRRQIECWTCQGKGHISRWCPHRNSGNEQGNPYASAASQKM